MSFLCLATALHLTGLLVLPATYNKNFLSPPLLSAGNLNKANPKAQIFERIITKIQNDSILQVRDEKGVKVLDKVHEKGRLVVYYIDTGGRLGNQMFMYASALGIAEAQGRQLAGKPPRIMKDTFQFVYI